MLTPIPFLAANTCQRLANTIGLFTICFLLVGCSPSSKKPVDAEKKTPKRSAVTLRVAVESDADLERAILRLRGEWNEFSGGQIETAPFSTASSDSAIQSLSEAANGADLIVFASRNMGPLCEQHLIRPMRKSVLQNETLNFEDYFPLIRTREIVYGHQTMALPIGCPTPVLALSSQQVTNQETEHKATASQKLALPTNPTELALVYLAYAAPHAVHENRETTLFDKGGTVDELTSRLAAPPFVRALELLIDSAATPTTETTAAEVTAKILWPQRQAANDTATNNANYTDARPAAVATAHYNSMADDWEPLSNRQAHATLIASSGRLLAVTSSSRNAATAFRYAAWLASPTNSRLLSAASDHVANPRGSLGRTADSWLPTGNTTFGKKIAAVQARSLREQRFLMTPRLPGGDRYLKSLGLAVQQALDGELSAQEAMAQAATDWDAISADLGPAKQRAAYLRSAGVADYQPHLAGNAR